MGLSDVAGVFSRFFIVGFFIPAFFGLFAAAELGTDEVVPDRFQSYSAGTQILILGAGALLLGLFLLGLHRPVIRTFEGYPIAGLGLDRPFVGIQQRRFDELAKRKAAGGPQAEAETRSQAMKAWLKLDRYFPDDRSRLLPTRFGNALRASEDYSYNRWKLDAIPFWAHVEPLLLGEERDLHEAAKTDIAFYLNASLAAIAVGIFLVVDGVRNNPLDAAYVWAYVIPFVLAYLIYRFSIDGAQRWGVEIRASLDLHRLEVYDRIGMRRPTSFTDERDVIAPALNRLFLYAIVPPDELWAQRSEKGDA